MTHILIMSGTASGGAASDTINLEHVVNESIFGAQRLEYSTPGGIQQARVLNTNTFGAQVLGNVVLSLINQAQFINPNTFKNHNLLELPFVADNAETTALLAVYTGAYSTTDKIQIDTLMTELKDAGLWAKFDWYGNAYWAKNEHDALIDWTNPTRSLYKIGAASFVVGEGLKGVNPMLTSGRFASGWDVGDGAHSTNINLSMFCKITAIDVPQNGMLPMGCWTLASPGPSTPFGSFLSISPVAGTGFAGAYCANGEGNNFSGVGDGLGVWTTALSGGLNKTFKDGVQLDSDAIVTVLSSGVTHADGICVAGSTGSGGTTRSFPGTIVYWGWASGLTLADSVALEDAFQAALLPPDTGPPPYVPVPDYANMGGMGNRPYIEITTTATLGSGGLDKLVNGLFTADGAGSIYMNGGQTLREIKFNLTSVGGPQVINEAKWYQDTTNNHGVWKWQGSNDNSIWTDIGSTFTLGGVATQIHTTLNGNTAGYLYYKLLQVSGVTSSGPWLKEIEFKIAPEILVADSTPNYGHAQGMGDRTALITVTTTMVSGTLGGTINNIVDGGYTSNGTEAWNSNTAATGAQNFTFDFGAPRVINEAFSFYTSSSVGVWKWQGSNESATSGFVDIGATFTLNLTNTQKHTTLNGNTLAYRWYRLLLTSGTHWSTSNFLEINFQIDQ